MEQLVRDSDVVEIVERLFARKIRFVFPCPKFVIRFGLDGLYVPKSEKNTIENVRKLAIIKKYIYNILSENNNHCCKNKGGTAMLNFNNKKTQKKIAAVIAFCLCLPW